MTTLEETTDIRAARAAGNIIVQDGKSFTGQPNWNTKSAVKFIYFNEKGTQVCSSMRSKSDHICTSVAIQENGRCKFHGGKSLGGVSHPGFKGGRYARNLPTRLLDRYEEALQDEKIADFHDDLALIEARIEDLMGQMSEGGGGEVFKEAKDAYRSFVNANADGDAQAMREGLRRLETALNEGSKEAYLWTELRTLQEQRRKIILAQAKHLQLTNQTVTVTKVNLLISALLDSVRRNVTDPKVLRDINSDFLRITGGGQKLLQAKN